MRLRTVVLMVILGGSIAPRFEAQDQPALATPGFHHLHLNSTNPEAAIDFYTKNFLSTSKVTFAGQPALKAGRVYVLFTKVNSAPPLKPQSAFWHFGWHVTDERASEKHYQDIGTKLLPLYTGDGDGFVWINSDTWPGGGGPGGALGRTKAQIAEAKEKGIQPTHAPAGFAYIGGPDGAMIEYQGNMPAERFNHVHMYEDDPFCAQLWYQKHLNVRAGGRGPTYTEANCKVEPGTEKSWPALEKDGMYRVPSAGVAFDANAGSTPADNVTMQWYVRQDDKPLAPTRGQMMDHVGLSVTDLDAWVAKLKAENVKFLQQMYKVGDYRAVMIEGPSREAIELLEVK
jgi:catechol 2,3-dioxygenase-like lactoylglutathione lyase family enzyme